MASKHNVWMSVSDLMTGLMIIFLFISIAYMEQEKEQRRAVSDYVDTRTKLQQKLEHEFENDTAEWKLRIGKDLTMRFQKPEVLFANSSAAISKEFKDILDEFIPRYIDILIHDSLKNKISEIRIEGHTDDEPFVNGNDPYIDNAELSQKRALSVLKYIRNMTFIKKYNEADKKRLEFWFTANGLSYGKSLDDNGEYTFITNKPINMELSRRVEFRIVTTGEQVLENFVKNNKIDEYGK